MGSSSVSLADSNICRLCGIDSENPVLIFDAEDEEPLCIKINKYLPIQVCDDGRHPRRVCGSCYLSVTATQVFLERALEGQRAIHGLLHRRPPAQPLNGSERVPLYPPGNALQNQLTTEGILQQKRRRGRPRKTESRLKDPEAKPAPVSVPPEPPVPLDRSQRPRGRLPARFQNSVKGRELERMLERPGEGPAPPLEPSGAQESGSGAPCHIRVEVLPVPGQASGRTGEAAPDGGSAPAEEGDRLISVVTETLAPIQPPENRPRARGGRRKLRFQCDVCDKRFCHEGRLNFHRALHRGVRYECLACNVRFKLNAELAFHQTETGHTGQGVVEGVDGEALVDHSRLPCTQCERTFKSPSTLQIHTLQQHNPDKQFSCDVCQKRFGQLGLLNLHLKSHAGRSGPRFSCGECGRVFNSRSARTYHTETVHGAGGRLFLCNLCGKSFRHQQLLARHALVHSTVRNWKCSECPSSFKTRSHLSAHMVRHTGERRFPCHLCPQRFAHKTSLNTHLRWHTGEKRLECSVCKKRFSHSSNLSEHERTHTGEKPYPCTVCSKAFATACQLKTHLRRHGPGRQLVCPTCDKVLPSRDRWRAHVLLHDPLRQPTCPTCGTRLPDRAALRDHMRTHAPAGRDPSLVCDVCSWSCEDAASLQQHRHSHSAAGRQLVPATTVQPSQVPESPPPDVGESQVIYVSYQNPADLSSVQLLDDVAAEDGARTVQLSADSEVLLEDAAAGVVQLAANKGLVTAEGTRQLELTTEDGRHIQVTLQDVKGDLEPSELAVTSDPAGEALSRTAEAAEPSEAELTREPSGVTRGPSELTREPSELTREPSEVTRGPSELTREPSGVTRGPSELTREPSELTREPSEVVVTASDGRQFRLVTPAGDDPVRFATEYIAGLGGGPGAAPG